MLAKNTKRNQGFTIIEVLIVLAIAGLILLIVFLAVPALNRNARNTQYKNDAAGLIGAASESSNNNQGKIPVAADKDEILALAKTRSITDITVAKGAGSDTPSFEKAVLRTGVKCDAKSGSAYATKASSARAMALIYAVEDSAGNVVPQCTES